jgi:murein L,D-transpeptidase YcbB/YkuD
LALSVSVAPAVDAQVQFGPVGEGPAQYNSGYDRNFIREWQVNPPKGFPTLSKTNLAPMKAAITRYEEILAAGGFLAIPEVELEPGATDPAIATLRKRLFASGDLTDASSSYPDYYGNDLATAVKRFQASNGLAPTGVIDKRTVGALNVPASVRLAQLKVNLERLTDLSKLVPKRYVLVNIPAAQVEAIEADTVVSRHSGVVGKPDRPTPMLRSTITDLAFNPMWTLPPTVIKEDLIPKGRDMQAAGQSVLAKFGIDAYEGGKKIDPDSIDWSTGRPTQLSYRQAPGKDNPLGFLKINFANSSSVYMHDSPKESLFGRNFRAASSGCVRVQNIEELATWLLTGQGSAEQVQHLKESGQSKTVRLRKPVPLYFAYITAWATKDGVIQFRPDVYLKDGVGEVASAY